MFFRCSIQIKTKSGEKGDCLGIRNSRDSAKIAPWLARLPGTPGLGLPLASQPLGPADLNKEPARPLDRISISISISSSVKACVICCLGSRHLFYVGCTTGACGVGPVHGGKFR